MKHKTDFYIVGIVAAVGQVNALRTFFDNLPTNTRAAYLLVTPLNPSFKGALDKFRSSFTAMPVLEPSKRLKIKPNHIYLIPENQEITLEEGYLRTDELTSNHRFSQAVNPFFHSLAESYADKSVGIVFSETGSRAAHGLQHIKEKGGLIMVQNSPLENFNQTAAKALASDRPDYTSPPDVLAKELGIYLSNSRLLDPERLISEKEERNNQRSQLQEILHQVSNFSAINFRNYKAGTIIRRIEKRLKINHLSNLEEYIQYIKANPGELHYLHQDLLIGVTRFFRDTEAFDSLEQYVLPALFDKRESQFDPVRIWTVACSTGEEAYSLAMLIEDYQNRHRLNIEYKIFATDVDQRAIEIASAGRYSLAIEEDLEQDLLKRYFTKLDKFYEIKKEIRRRIIFSRHNLLSDPPFIRLDLVTCRNLFIYLLDDLQNRLLQNFNYSLQPEGYLMLGVNESINEQENLFKTIDHKNKIFKNKPGPGTRGLRPANFFSQDSAQPHQPNRIQHNRISTPPAEEEKYADMVAEHFAPPSLLLSPQEDVLYTIGPVHQFVNFPNKRTDLNVYSMLQGNLILIFRNALRQLASGENNILFPDTPIEKDQKQYVVDLQFSSISSYRGDSRGKLWLVEFRDKQQATQKQVRVVTEAHYSRAEVETLEMELKMARRELRFTADELETINEELQSSNEEMQSSNEELQSTNEELQSANEELQTVNLELKSKIEAITILHDDVNNLFNSTQIATVFLDSNLNIRKFTPQFTYYFNIRETDIGRPISDYSYNFDHPGLMDDLRQVLDSLQPLEQEIEHRENSYSIMRVLPYKTESRQIKGVVITFTDITEIKRNVKKLRKLSEDLLESERHLKSLLDHSPDYIARFDRHLRFTFANQALLEAAQQPNSKLMGQEAGSLELLGDDPTQQLLTEVLHKGHVRDYYSTYRGGVKPLHLYTKLVPEFAEGTREIQSILSVSRDISLLKSAETNLRTSHQQLSEMVERMDNFVHAIAHDLRTPLINLKMLTDLFKNSTDVNEQEEFVQMVSNSVNKLDNTLNGLVKIIELGNDSKLNFERVGFSKVWEQVLQELNAQIIESGAELTTFFTNCPDINYPRVYLNSILQNLLSNALKYRHPGRKPDINISTENQKNYVVLTVRDNGSGFNSKSIQEQLFKPFKRFHPQTNGLGVGLYIIKYMVERNGGTIRVSSQVNQGTTFTLHLVPYESSAHSTH